MKIVKRKREDGQFRVVSADFNVFAEGRQRGGATQLKDDYISAEFVKVM